MQERVFSLEGTVEHRVPRFVIKVSIAIKFIAFLRFDTNSKSR